MSGKAACILLAVTLMSLAAGCLDEEEPLFLARFSEPILVQRQLNNTTVWDCYFNFTDIVATRGDEDSRMEWNDLAIWIKSSSGVLVQMVNLTASPGAFDAAIASYFIERVGSAKRPDVGDGMMISPLTRELEGTSVNVVHQWTSAEGYLEGEIIGIIPLPTTF